MNDPAKKIVRKLHSNPDSANYEVVEMPHVALV